MRYAVATALLALGLIGCQAQNGEIGGTLSLTSSESFDKSIEALKQITDDLSEVLGPGTPSGTFTYGGSADNSDFNLDYTSGGTDVSNGFVEIDVDFSNLEVTKFNGFNATDTAKATPVIQLHDDHSVNVNPKTGTIGGILTTTTGSKLLSVDGNFYVQYVGLIGEFDEVGGTSVSGDFQAVKAESETNE